MTNIQSSNGMIETALMEVRSNIFHSPPREQASSLDNGAPPTMIYSSAGKVVDRSSSRSSLRWGKSSESDSASVMSTLPLIPITKSLLQRQPSLSVKSSNKTSLPVAPIPPPPPPPPPPLLSLVNDKNKHGDAANKTDFHQQSLPTESLTYTKNSHLSELPNHVLDSGLIPHVPQSSHLSSPSHPLNSSLHSTTPPSSLHLTTPSFSLHSTTPTSSHTSAALKSAQSDQSMTASRDRLNEEIIRISRIFKDRRKKRPSLAPKNVEISKFIPNVTTVRNQIKPGIVVELSNLFKNRKENFAGSSPNPGNFDLDIQDTMEKSENFQQNKESVCANHLNDHDAMLPEAQIQPKEHHDIHTPPVLLDPMSNPGMDYLSASKEIMNQILSNINSSSKTDLTKQHQVLEDERKDSHNFVHDNVSLTMEQKHVTPVQNCVSGYLPNNSADFSDDESCHSISAISDTEKDKNDPGHKEIDNEVLSQAIISEPEGSNFGESHEKVKNDALPQLFSSRPEVGNVMDREVQYIMLDPNFEEGTIKESIDLHSLSQVNCDAERIAAQTSSISENEHLNVHSKTQQLALNNCDQYSDTLGNAQTDSIDEIKGSQKFQHSQFHEFAHQVDRSGPGRDQEPDHLIISSRHGNLNVGATTGDIMTKDERKVSSSQVPVIVHRDGDGILQEYTDSFEMKVTETDAVVFNNKTGEDSENLTQDHDHSKRSDDFLSILEDISIQTDITSSFLKRSSKHGGFVSDEPYSSRDIDSRTNNMEVIDGHAANNTVKDEVDGVIRVAEVSQTVPRSEHEYQADDEFKNDFISHERNEKSPTIHLSDRSSLSSSSYSDTEKLQAQETSFNSEFFARPNDSTYKSVLDSSEVPRHVLRTELEHKSQTEFPNLPNSHGGKNNLENSQNLNNISTASHITVRANENDREKHEEFAKFSEDLINEKASRSTSRQNSLIEATHVSREVPWSDYAEKSHIEFTSNPASTERFGQGNSYLDERRTSLSSTHSYRYSKHGIDSKETLFSKDHFSPANVSGLKNQDIPSRKHSLIVATEISRSIPWSNYENVAHFMSKTDPELEQNLVRGQSFDAESRNESHESNHKTSEALPNSTDSSDVDSCHSISSICDTESGTKIPYNNFTTEAHPNPDSSEFLQPTQQAKETYVESTNATLSPLTLNNKEETTEQKDDESHLFSKDAFQALKSIFEKENQPEQTTFVQSKRSSFHQETRLQSPVRAASSTSQHTDGVSNKFIQSFTSQRDSETKPTPDVYHRVEDLYLPPRFETGIDAPEQIDTESADSSDESDIESHVDARGKRMKKKKSKQNYFSYNVQTGELIRSSFSHPDSTGDSTFRNSVNEPQFETSKTRLESDRSSLESRKFSRLESDSWNERQLSSTLDAGSELDQHFNKLLDFDSVDSVNNETLHEKGDTEKHLDNFKSRTSVKEATIELDSEQPSSDESADSSGVRKTAIRKTSNAHSESLKTNLPQSSVEHEDRSLAVSRNRYISEHAQVDLHRRPSLAGSDKSSESDRSSRRSSTDLEAGKPTHGHYWIGKPENELFETDFSRQTSAAESSFRTGERKQSNTESDKQSELINTFLRSSGSVHCPGQADSHDKFSESFSHFDKYFQDAPASSGTGDLFSNLSKDNFYSETKTREVNNDNNNKEETMTALVGKVSSFGIHKVSSHDETFGVTDGAATSSISPNIAPQTLHDQNGSDVYLIQDNKGDYYVLQEVDGEETNSFHEESKAQVITHSNEHQSNFIDVKSDPSDVIYYTSGGATADLYVDSTAVEEDKAREVISAFLNAQDSGKQQNSHTIVSGAYITTEDSAAIKHRYSHRNFSDDKERWGSSSPDGSSGKLFTVGNEGNISSPNFVSSLGHGSVVIQQDGYNGVKSSSLHSDEYVIPAGYKRLSKHPADGQVSSSTISGNMQVDSDLGDSQTWKKSKFEHLNSGPGSDNTYTSSLVVTNLSSPRVQQSYSSQQRVADTSHNSHWSSGSTTNNVTHSQVQPAAQFPGAPMTITTTTQAVVGEQVGMHIDYSPTTGIHPADPFSSSSDEESNHKRYIVNSTQKSSLKRTSQYGSSLSDTNSDVVFTKSAIPADSHLNGRTRHHGHGDGSIIINDNLSPRTVIDGPVYKHYQSTSSYPARSLSPTGTSYPNNDNHYPHDMYASSSLTRHDHGENLYRIRNLSTSVPNGLNFNEEQRGRSSSRKPKYSDSERLYKVRKQPHSPERFFRNAKLSLRKDDYENKDYFSDDETDNKQYRTVTKVYLNNGQQNSEPQKSDTHYKVSSHQSHTSYDNHNVQDDGKIYEVVKVKSSDDHRSGSPGLSESDSGFQEQQPKYKVIGSSDSSTVRHRVEAHSSPKFDRKNVKSYEEATITRTQSVQPSRHDPPQTKTHKTVIQLETEGGNMSTSPVVEDSYMVKRVKSMENLLTGTKYENFDSYSSADRKLWRTGRSRSTDIDRSRSGSDSDHDDMSPRLVKTLKQKDGKRTYIVNSTVSDNAAHPLGWYRSTIDINEEAPENFNHSQKLNQERSDSHSYRTEKTVYFTRETAQQSQTPHKSDFVYPDSGTEVTNSDGENEVRQKFERVERIYEIRTEPQLPENIQSVEDLSNDLRVLRGNILIKNRLNETGHDEDDFDENVNLFDNSFHLGKDNPLFSSDPDLMASLQREEEEEELAKHVQQDITFETVDRIAHKYKDERQVAQAPQRKKQNLSALLLSKLANVDSKDIRQTIDVEHHNEEIYGDIDFIHADGQRKSSMNTRNFDSVNEKVELTLTQGKAYVIIKVIAERIVPTDYEFNVWRKSQAIVTRQIEIDLLANEQRRRLYKHVMDSAGNSGSLEDGSRHRYQDTEALSPQERQLSSMETLKLFSQILDVTDGQGDKDHTDTRTRQEMGQLPPSAMDLLY